MVVLVIAKIGRFVENVKTVALFVKEQKGKNSVILHRNHKEHESFKLKTGMKRHFFLRESLVKEWLEKNNIK